MAFRRLLRNDRVMLGGPFDPSSKSVEKSNVPDDSEMWDPDGCLRSERGSLLNDNLRPDDKRDVYYEDNLIFPLFQSHSFDFAYSFAHQIHHAFCRTCHSLHHWTSDEVDKRLFCGSIGFIIKE